MKKLTFTKLTKLILLSALLCVSLSGCLLSGALGTRFVYFAGDLGGCFDSESHESLAILMRDIRSFAVYDIPENKSKTLDLNGHKIICTTRFFNNTIFTVNGDFTIKDSGTGGLIKDEGNANCVIYVSSSGTLRLESCNIESNETFIRVQGELIISEEMYNSIKDKIVRERYGRITLTD